MYAIGKAALFITFLVLFALFALFYVLDSFHFFFQKLPLQTSFTEYCNFGQQFDVSGVETRETGFSSADKTNKPFSSLFRNAKVTVEE